MFSSEPAACWQGAVCGFRTPSGDLGTKEGLGAQAWVSLLLSWKGQCLLNALLGWASPGRAKGLGSAGLGSSLSGSLGAGSRAVHVLRMFFSTGPPLLPLLPLLLLLLYLFF